MVPVTAPPTTPAHALLRAVLDHLETQVGPPARPAPTIADDGGDRVGRRGHERLVGHLTLFHRSSFTYPSTSQTPARRPAVTVTVALPRAADAYGRRSRPIPTTRWPTHDRPAPSPRPGPGPRAGHRSRGHRGRVPAVDHVTGVDRRRRSPAHPRTSPRRRGHQWPRPRGRRCPGPRRRAHLRASAPASRRRRRRVVRGDVGGVDRARHQDPVPHRRRRPTALERLPMGPAADDEQPRVGLASQHLVEPVDEDVLPLARTSRDRHSTTGASPRSWRSRIRARAMWSGAKRVVSTPGGTCSSAARAPNAEAKRPRV